MTTPTRKPSWLHRLLRFSLFSFLVGIGILAGVLLYALYTFSRIRAGTAGPPPAMSTN